MTTIKDCIIKGLESLSHREYPQASTDYVGKWAETVTADAWDTIIKCDITKLLSQIKKEYTERSIKFSELIKEMEKMTPESSSIDFRVRENGIVYTAFCARIGGDFFYGFHSIKDKDYAVMSRGWGELDLAMLNALVDYNGERFEKFTPDPKVYVLD